MRAFIGWRSLYSTFNRWWRTLYICYFQLVPYASCPKCAHGNVKFFKKIHANSTHPLKIIMNDCFCIMVFCMNSSCLHSTNSFCLYCLFFSTPAHAILSLKFVVYSNELEKLFMNKHAKSPTHKKCNRILGMKFNQIHSQSSSSTSNTHHGTAVIA